MVGELLHMSLSEVRDLPEEELVLWWAWGMEGRERAD